MDPITKAQVAEFAKSQGLGKKDAPTQFEYFASFCCCAQHYSDTFDIDQLSTGDFQGVDGIATIVNGVIVESVEEIEELVELNGYLDANFIFVQAKTSSGFDLGDMGKFAEATLSFFEDDPTLTAHPDVADKHALKEFIYSQASRFRRNPQLNLYYVTTGRWDGVPALETHRAKALSRLNDTNLFSDVAYDPVDAKQLQDWYRKTRTSRVAEIVFDKSIPLPSIPKVKEAFLGVLPGDEFLKLLDDGSGNILKSIFYENIRDYQRGSPVNVGIAQTLSEGKGDEFVLRNNGVTIVAGKVSRVGTKFKLEDYQIVNGCQTSHVVFESRSHVTSNTFVPLKLIVTEDEDVRSQIVVSSNSQNKIVQEQLWALDQFQKNLESYFESPSSDDEKLYYERRSKQYDSAPNVEKVRIVVPGDLARAFASMFLGEPHKAGRYYKELLDYIPQGKLFAEAHKLKPYYISAFSAYRLAWLFRNKSMDNRLKLFRFHVLFSLKTLVMGGATSPLSSKQIEKECEPLQKLLFDAEMSEQVFRIVFEIVEESLSKLSLAFARDSARVQGFRDEVLSASLDRREQTKGLYTW